MIEELEIMCWYLSNEGREARYYDIVNKNDWMVLEGIGPHDFRLSSGGFSITLNGFNTIFKSNGFYDILTATSFLFKTFCWIKMEKTSWCDSSYSGEDEVLIGFGYGERLSLKSNTMTTISLSYYKEDEKWQRQRGDYFFENILIDKTQWLKAVEIALNEYFLLMNEAFQGERVDAVIQNMLNFYSEWERLKGV